MKKIWKFLNGKKSAIAATINALLIWAVAMGYLDQNTSIMLAAITTAWTGVAVGHKVKKGELVNR